jgi:hypothetical protein
VVFPQCDRDRPKCSTCRKRGLECVYREKAEIEHESSEIVDALQSLSEQHAFAVLRSLRATRDPTVALNVVRRKAEPAEDLSKSNHALGMGVSPQSYLEFELTSRYPTAYLPITSASASALVGRNLVHPVSQAETPSPRERYVTLMVENLFPPIL